ncbi:hypothetical protein [Streptacidiphilus monticola]|uniref:DUF317 domain-containing protein n=1 Tax=Streptacidiphilus monticola TaxID=2161674 RepID=A0ABW1G9T4_9ACTN
MRGPGPAVKGVTPLDDSASVVHVTANVGGGQLSWTPPTADPWVLPAYWPERLRPAAETARSRPDRVSWWTTSAPARHQAATDLGERAILDTLTGRQLGSAA